MQTLEMTVKLDTAQEREAFFTEIYLDAFPAVATYVRNRGGTLEQAKDVFHEALVVYFEKMTSEKSEAMLTPERYVVGVAKHLWLKQYREGIRETGMDEISGERLSSEEKALSVKSSMILALLTRTGEKCMELLSAFYYTHESVKSICERFGYRSEHSVSVQKYKCLEKIRDTVKEKSLSYEDFLE